MKFLDKLVNEFFTQTPEGITHYHLWTKLFGRGKPLQNPDSLPTLRRQIKVNYVMIFASIFIVPAILAEFTRHSYGLGLTGTLIVFAWHYFSTQAYIQKK